MISSPTVGLTQVISRGLDANEAQLSKEVENPTFEIDADAQTQLRHFQSFCQTRGVRFFPAHPASIAAFALSENAYGVPHPRIITALEAIETKHDNAALPNPVQTSIVRAALCKIMKISEPRSWSAREKLLFCTLPISVQAVIEKRSAQDTKEVRRSQNEAAELRKQLQPKESETKNES